MEPNPYLVQVPTDMLLGGIAKLGNRANKIFNAANKAHGQHTTTVRGTARRNLLRGAMVGFETPAKMLIGQAVKFIKTKDQDAQKREQAEQTRLQQKDENLKRAEEAAAHDTHPANAHPTTHTRIEINHPQKPVVHATHTHLAHAHPTTHTHDHPTTHTHAHPTTHPHSAHAHPATHTHSAHAHLPTHPHISPHK